MSAQVTSMLAYRMRQVAANHGDSVQIAETVKSILERERNLLSARASGGPVGATRALHRLQVLPTA